MADGMQFQFDGSVWDTFVKTLLDEQPAIIGETLDEVGAVAVREAASRTPIGETGRARRGWNIAQRIVTAKEAFVLIANDVFYTRFLEFGAKGRRPIRMLRKTIRVLRRRGEPVKKLRSKFVRGAIKSKRRAERRAGRLASQVRG